MVSGTIETPDTRLVTQMCHNLAPARAQRGQGPSGQLGCKKLICVMNLGAGLKHDSLHKYCQLAGAESDLILLHSTCCICKFKLQLTARVKTTRHMSPCVPCRLCCGLANPAHVNYIGTPHMWPARHQAPAQGLTSACLWRA